MGRWIGIGLALLAVLSIAFIAVLYIFPDFRVATRDIAVVVVALFQIISTLLLIALLLALIFAVRAVDRVARTALIPRIDTLTAKVDALTDDARAIVTNVKDTTSSVSTTTGYVAEQVVSPVIRASGLLAGVRAAARFLANREP